LAFSWPNIKLVGLKKIVWPFGSCFAAIGSYEGKYTTFFRQHNWKIFVTNAILDRRSRSDISNILGMRVSKQSFA